VIQRSNPPPAPSFQKRIVNQAIQFLVDEIYLILEFPAPLDLRQDLGLYIAREIATAHLGDISAESDENENCILPR
jgi:hypothetical protein